MYLCVLEKMTTLRAWILKYISDNCQSKWKAFFDFYLLKFGGKLVFTSNLARKDVKILDIKSTFLHELIELWSDLKFKESFASRAEFGIHMEQLNDKNCRKDYFL